MRDEASHEGARSKHVPGTLVVAIVAVLLALANGLTWWTGRGSIFWGLGVPHGWSFLYFAGVAALLLTAAFLLRERRALSVPDRPGLLAGAAFLLFAVTSGMVLRGFLNSGDEYAYLFQAETYLAGRLWNPAPPLGQAVASMYTWVAGDRWIGQYPPGWPAIIAAFRFVHVPTWLIGPLLTSATVFLLGALIREKTDLEARALFAAFLALAPFTVFTAASLHSHVIAALLIVAAVLASERALRLQSFRWAIALGAAVGLLLTVRYISAVVVALPLGCALLLSRDRVKLCAGAVLGGLPFLAIVLGYHWAITGDPLKPVYYLTGRDVDHLYFDGPSIARGLWLTAIRLWDFGLWTSPVIPLLWLAAFFLKAKRKAIAAADLILPFAIVLLVFYPRTGGNAYGPRYYFEYWPLALYTIATGLTLLTDERRRTFGTNLIALSCLYAALLWPLLAIDYSRIVDGRRDLYDQAAQKGLHRAAVCAASKTGKQLPLLLDDLPRNGVDAKGDVLYARCDLTTPAALQAAHPGRQVWIYERRADEERGTLRPYRATGAGASAKQP